MEINNILYIPKKLNEIFFGSDNDKSKYVIFALLIISIISLIIMIIKNTILYAKFLFLLSAIALIFYIVYTFQNKNTLSNLDKHCLNPKNKQEKDLCNIYRKSKNQYDKINKLLFEKIEN